jgi:hypothetical protein
MTDAIPIADLVIHNSPDVRSWPIGTRLTALELRTNGVYVEFDRKDGPTRWPDVTPPGWDGPLQYTLWLCMNIGGVWHAAGLMEYWHGLDVQGGNVLAGDQIAKNWTYDCKPMNRQPGAGEIVGWFVTAGDARKKDVHVVAERSQIDVTPWPVAVPATFRFQTEDPQTEPDPGESPQPDPVTDLYGPAILSTLATLANDLIALRQRIDAIAATPPAWPTYEGRVFGASIVLRPK